LASKNVVTFPSLVVFRTLPSLPVPAHNVPSPVATTVHRKGAAVSAIIEVDGPRNTRPSLSIDSPSTSPLRKSVCVDTVQNVGTAATSVAARIAMVAIVATILRTEPARPTERRTAVRIA
jgi:hypothetical protein